MSQPDGLRLYIFESSELVCATKGLHRSGARLRPISPGDFVLSSGGDPLPCGKIIAVDAERIDRENWVYRVQYRPLPNTVHPIDGFVVWKQIYVAPQKPFVPEPIAQRMQPVVPATHPVIATNEIPMGEIGVKTPVPNGRKRKQKVTVANQQGNGAPASASSPTA